MKRIISILLCGFILMCAMSVFAAATAGGDTYTYEINDKQCTVIFEDDSIPSEKQQALAAGLIGLEYSDAAPANIWCDLFGHDLVNTTADVVEHKVRSYSPRCCKKTYDLTYCEDCAYSEQTLLRFVYITCCPVD